MKERAGIIMDYVTKNAVTHNVPVLVGTVVGIPNTDFAASDTDNYVALTCEGVFELAKDTAAITQGAKVYLDTDNKITATDTGNTYAGVAWSAAEADATVVDVKINA